MEYANKIAKALLTLDNEQRAKRIEEIKKQSYALWVDVRTEMENIVKNG